MTARKNSCVDYNGNSRVQLEALLGALSLLPESATAAYLGIERSVTIADYGSCEGQNSILFICELLERLSGLEKAVVLFNDQPSNDFSSLSRTIADNTARLSLDGKLQTFSSMIPRSFFEQVTPDSTVDVGICMSSLHWLRPESEGIGHRYLPRGQAAQDAAHRDLLFFLQCRSRETRKGGSLLLGIVGDGSCTVETALECLSLAIDDLQVNGYISKEVAATCRGPVYFRSQSEIANAIEEEGNWVVTQQFNKSILSDSQLWLDTTSGAAQISEDQWNEFARKAGETIIASAGNTILTAVRSHGDQVDEAKLLKILQEYFEVHFRRDAPRDVNLGGEYYFLHLTRQ